jgi:hypothetical protein
MAWLSGLLHLLGALPDIAPAALVAGIAIAVLAIAIRALTRPSGTHAGPTLVAIARRRNGSTVLVRVNDPDAPGRARPRAPSE